MWHFTATAQHYDTEGTGNYVRIRESGKTHILKEMETILISTSWKHKL